VMTCLMIGELITADAVRPLKLNPPVRGIARHVHTFPMGNAPCGGATMM
jgi:hypothetical protein